MNYFLKVFCTTPYTSSVSVSHGPLYWDVALYLMVHYTGM